jgi:hypothetical protein
MSTNTYYPDCWVIVEISGAETKTHHKVLAGFIGGYVHGNSWRLSSAIAKIVDRGEFYEIHNYTGSIYYCDKNTEQFNYYTQSIYQQQQIAAKGIEQEYYRMLISDVLHLYENKHD